MKKILTALVVSMIVVGLGGCFPVFIPVGDHYYGYHHRGYR